MKQQICAFVVSLTVFVLLSIIYNEINYLYLDAKIGELREENFELLRKYEDLTWQHKSSRSDKLIAISPPQKRPNYVTGSFLKNIVQFAVTSKERKNTRKERTTDLLKTSSFVNKFEDLHKYSKFNPSFRKYMVWPPDYIQEDVNPTVSEILKTPITANMSNWMKFNLQISKQYLYDENSTVVEDMLHDMLTQKIVKIHKGEGNQFDLLVTFENGGTALFKPQRYPKDQEPAPNMLYFTEFERHFSEIAAYHLDRILGFRRVPPTIGRRISLTGELFKLAYQNLSTTFFYSPDGNYCFHGRCQQYCETPYSFCGSPDLLEGSFSVRFLSEPDETLHRRIVLNPWKRTYQYDQFAPWEDNLYYCVDNVKGEYFYDSDRRLFDVIDCAIFDYLMGNMDRPNFEEFSIFGEDSKSNLLHMSNGRGFGRADKDEDSILAPLYQCCGVRLSTFNKLYSFYVGPHPLSYYMKESLAKDPLAPILTERHLKALDRRVEYVLEKIRMCIKGNLAAAIFLDDM